MTAGRSAALALAKLAARVLAKLAARERLALDIKAPPPGVDALEPLGPFHEVEHAIAQLGRWRRLSRGDEGVPLSPDHLRGTSESNLRGPAFRSPDETLGPAMGGTSTTSGSGDRRDVPKRRRGPIARACDRPRCAAHAR